MLVVVDCVCWMYCFCCNFVLWLYWLFCYCVVVVCLVSNVSVYWIYVFCYWLVVYWFGCVMLVVVVGCVWCIWLGCDWMDEVYGWYCVCLLNRWSLGCFCFCLLVWYRSCVCWVGVWLCYVFVCRIGLGCWLILLFW